MNERNFSYQNNDSIAYYGVDGEGRLFRKPTEEELTKGGKDIVPHTFTKGEKTGQTIMRKIAQSIYGVVTAFWVKSSDFGDSLIVEIYENRFTSVLQIPFDSSFSDDLIRKINNMVVGKVYSFQPWKMQAKDQNGKEIKDKFVRGVSVKDQTGNKIERFLTKEKQEQLLPLSTCPLFEKDSDFQSKDFWQIYFKLLGKAFKERIIPTNNQRFQNWAKDNVTSNVQEEHEAINEQPQPLITTNQNISVKDLNSADSFPTLKDEPKGEPELVDDLPF